MRPGLPCTRHTQIQPAPATHHRAQLSPSAKMVAPCGKSIEKKGKNHCAEAVREKSEKNVRKTALQTQVREGGG